MEVMRNNVLGLKIGCVELTKFALCGQEYQGTAGVSDQRSRVPRPDGGDRLGKLLSLSAKSAWHDKTAPDDSNEFLDWTLGLYDRERVGMIPKGNKLTHDTVRSFLHWSLMSSEGLDSVDSCRRVDDEVPQTGVKRFNTCNWLLVNLES
jgi:hypothetical protein